MQPLLLVGFLLFAAAAGYIALARRRRNALRAACMSVFTEAYAQVKEKPLFHMSYGYGVPIFKVTHKSKEAHSESEISGANAEFTAGIQRVCGASGSQGNPYQASRAIQFAWAVVGNEVFYPVQKPPSGASEA